MLLFKKSSFLYKHLVDYYTNNMSSTSATQIEQSVSAQQLTASDEQALYHLHQQYDHEQLQLQDPTAAILHAAAAAGGGHESPPSHNQQNSISHSPISGVSDSGGNSAKDGKRNGHGRMHQFLFYCILFNMFLEKSLRFWLFD